MVNWTEEQIIILKEQYKTKPARDIGMIIGKSREAVIAMAKRLQIKKVDKWNTQQENFLTENYPIYASNVLIKKLGKGEFAIRKKAERLGLKKSVGYRNKQNIENIPKRNYSEPNSFSSFICGFTAGEGSFIKAKNGKMRFKFSIALADDDQNILEDIKSFFGVGAIRKYPPRKEKWKGSVLYHVGDIPTLIKVIIPFFDKYGFFSARKQKQYLLWKQDLFKHASYSDDSRAPRLGSKI